MEHILCTSYVPSISLCVKLLSRVRLSATPWTVARQAPPSMGFSRQEYWSGLPFPSPGDLPNPGIEPRSPTLQADSLLSEPPGKAQDLLELTPKKDVLFNIGDWNAKVGSQETPGVTGKFGLGSQAPGTSPTLPQPAPARARCPASFRIPRPNLPVTPGVS